MNVWLILGIALVLLGLVLFVTVMAANHWDFKALSTTTYETNVTQIDEEFQNILVDIDTAQFRLLPSEDGVARVECYEEATAKHTITVENGTLTIRVNNEKKWYEHIGVNFETPGITVYLPNAEYGNLEITGHTGGVMIPKNFCFKNINASVTTGGITCLAPAAELLKLKTGTGTIRVKEVHTDLLDLTVTTGRIAVHFVTCNGGVTTRVSTGRAVLTDVSCQSLTSSGNTGDLILRRVIASGDFSIERSTGDVSFDACDAAALSITTDTGDITGTLLTDKIFIASTDTGRVSVPKTSLGGKCEITTDTGDIKIEIHK